MAHPRVLERDASVLLVIDVQEGYRGQTIEHDRMVNGVRKLVEAAKLMRVPVIALWDW
jgi:nicotinamidase-related amidase